ncbi:MULTISPECIES: hypothetical protein [unclassified Burkholderia]|uniref:hypothetical protein n=1 Tax=unclassified Burkholderia TaxID=2613784 RepID=UPI00211D7654|nr:MULTISPECIES: hypothetical protein [unclassified Burkholderia]
MRQNPTARASAWFDAMRHSAGLVRPGVRGSNQDNLIQQRLLGGRTRSVENGIGAGFAERCCGAIDQAPRAGA